MEPPVLANLETNEEFRASGVPDQMQQISGARWNHQGGQSSAVRSDYLAPGPTRFSIDMRFETHLPGEPPADVRPHLEPLKGMTSEGENGHPPLCHFSWGTVTGPVFVDDAEVRYTRFDTEGRPTAAQVQLTMTRVDDKKKLKTAASWIPTTVASVTGPTIALAASAAKSLSGAARSVSGNVIALRDSVKATIQDGKNTAAEALDSVTETARELREDGEAIAKEVKAEAEKIQDEMDAVAKEIEQEVDKVKDEATQVKEEFEDAVDEAEKEIKEVEQEIAESIDEAKAAGKQVEETVNESADEIKDEVDKAKDEVAERTEALEQMHDDLGDEINQLGKDVDAATEIVNEASAAIDRAADDATKDIQEFESKVAVIGDGADDKVNEAKQDLEKKLEEHKEKAHEAVANAKSEIDAVEHQIKERAKAIEEAPDKVKERFQKHVVGRVDRASEAVSSVGDAAARFPKTIVDKIVGKAGESRSGKLAAGISLRAALADVQASESSFAKLAVFEEGKAIKIDELSITQLDQLKADNIGAGFEIDSKGDSLSESLSALKTVASDLVSSANNHRAKASRTMTAVGRLQRKTPELMAAAAGTTALIAGIQSILNIRKDDQATSRKNASSEAATETPVVAVPTQDEDGPVEGARKDMISKLEKVTAKLPASAATCRSRIDNFCTKLNHIESLRPEVISVLMSEADAIIAEAYALGGKNAKAPTTEASSALGRFKLEVHLAAAELQTNAEVSVDSSASNDAEFVAFAQQRLEQLSLDESSDQEGKDPSNVFRTAYLKSCENQAAHLQALSPLGPEVVAAQARRIYPSDVAAMATLDPSKREQGTLSSHGIATAHADAELAWRKSRKEEQTLELAIIATKVGVDLSKPIAHKGSS